MDVVGITLIYLYFSCVDYNKYTYLLYWHQLPNWDIIFKFGTVETLSSLLPLPLERQNIPDGLIIPHYPQNIQFDTHIAPNVPNSERTHPPTTFGIVYIYLPVSPTPTQQSHPIIHPHPPIRHPQHIIHFTRSPKRPYY